MRQHTQPDQETCSNQAVDLDAVLRRYVADPTASWGLGTFGAVAEFHRTGDEPVRLDTGATIEVVTARGALRIGSTEATRACAYEQPGHASESWSHVLTLCLPTAGSTMHRRTVLTECGPNSEALRPQDRAAILFDLGLGTTQVDVCVRTADPETLAHLRAGLGRSLFAPDNPLMQVMPRLSPHRVFVCRFARLEVYQRIPGHGETPPEGPHTHVLPHLLRHQRSHPATAPIPDGLVPCLSLYPANPMHDALGSRDRSTTRPMRTSSRCCVASAIPPCAPQRGGDRGRAGGPGAGWLFSASIALRTCGGACGATTTRVY